MNYADARQYIERETDMPVVDVNGGFHVSFGQLEKLTDAQWATVRAAHHDMTDKGAVFFAPRSELTPEGEQFVMPGCERDAAPSIKQLDLF